MSNASHRWFINAPRPCALSRRQRWMVFAALVAVGVAFAAFTALMFGAWVVIPFAGLELAAVGFAFWWWDAHAADFESIELDQTTLRFQRQFGKRHEARELPAAWLQVSRETKPTGWGGRRRLVIACRGQSITFGEFLNEAGVNECQRVLRDRLKPAWN
jgi:uncharacterized membrane protein